MLVTLVSVSMAVPLAIWLRRDAFLRHREPLLAFKHLGEAVCIAHLMPYRIWHAQRDYKSFLVQWCAHTASNWQSRTARKRTAHCNGLMDDAAVRCLAASRTCVIR